MEGEVEGHSWPNDADADAFARNPRILSPRMFSADRELYSLLNDHAWVGQKLAVEDVVPSSSRFDELQTSRRVSKSVDRCDATYDYLHTMRRSVHDRPKKSALAVYNRRTKGWIENRVKLTLGASAEF